MFYILALLYGLNTSQINMVKNVPIEFKIYTETPNYSGWYYGDKVEVYLGGCDNGKCENWIPFIVKNTIPHEMGHIIYDNIKTPELNKEILDNFPKQDNYEQLKNKFKSPTYKDTFNMPAEIYASNFARDTINHKEKSLFGI